MEKIRENISNIKFIIVILLISIITLLAIRVIFYSSEKVTIDPSSINNEYEEGNENKRIKRYINPNSFYGDIENKSLEKSRLNLNLWDVQILIKEDGNIKVTETWNVIYDMNVKTLYRNFEKGISKSNIKNPKVYEKVDGYFKPLKKSFYSYKQKEGCYHIGKSNKFTEIAWGVKPGTKHGSYVIEYELSGLAFLTKDNSYIYQNIIKNNNIYTNTFMATIKHETKKLTKENTLFFGHGRTNVNYSYVNGAIYISSIDAIRLNDFVGYKLVMPKDFLNPKKGKIKKENKTIEDIINDEYRFLDKSFSAIKKQYIPVYKNGKRIIFYMIRITVYSLSINYLIIKLKKRRNGKNNLENIKKALTELKAMDIKKDKQFEYDDFSLDLFKMAVLSGKNIKNVNIFKSSLLKLVILGFLNVEEVEISNGKTELIFTVNKQSDNNENLNKLSNVDDCILLKFKKLDKKQDKITSKDLRKMFFENNYEENDDDIVKALIENNKKDYELAKYVSKNRAENILSKAGYLEINKKGSFWQTKFAKLSILPVSIITLIVFSLIARNIALIQNEYMQKISLVLLLFFLPIALLFLIYALDVGYKAKHQYILTEKGKKKQKELNQLVNIFKFKNNPIIVQNLQQALLYMMLLGEEKQIVKNITDEEKESFNHCIKFFKEFVEIGRDRKINKFFYEYDFIKGNGILGVIGFVFGLIVFGPVSSIGSSNDDDISSSGGTSGVSGGGSGGAR